MRFALRYVERAVMGQQGFLFPWVPVFLALGIGLYFSLLSEPPVWLLALTGVTGLIGAALGRQPASVLGFAILAVALLLGGFALAGLRAHVQAGPVLGFRYYGAIEGRVVGIDRSASDAVRLTLDQVVLERMAPARTPLRVRVSLHGDWQHISSEPQPGARVMLTGHLSPPGGAVEPGGFDFRRHAWFQQLGAVGYSRTPLMTLAPPDGSLRRLRARLWLSWRVRQSLPGDRGAFAAALMSGDRSAIRQGLIGDLRDSNLAHLLAISGLHMGLLAGFTFGALRLFLVLLPKTREHTQNKRRAALGALAVAAGYLALSGGNVATERAFVMVAVALCAVMARRRVFSLRAVALAAVIILVWQPEALMGPGFQMSFAATTALVAVFEFASGRDAGRAVPRWLKPVLALVLSSTVAGLATMPVAMAHFNRLAQFGLLANLLAVPVMGLVVMPMAVLAALLMPFGLDDVALMLMGQGLGWILTVASAVSDLPGAVVHVKAPDPAALPLVGFGGLVLCLWRGWGRVLGVLPGMAGAVFWVMSDRPDLLIADTGGLVGIMTEQGRALSKDSGAGFIAAIWAENDGRGLTQDKAAALWEQAWRHETAQPRLKTGKLGPYDVITLSGKTATLGFAGCEPGQIVVSNQVFDRDPGCLYFDQSTLRDSGSVALRIGPKGLVITTAAEISGKRLWSR